MDKKNYLLFYCLLFFSIGCFGQKKAHIIIIGMPQRTFLTNKWDLEAKPLLRKVPSYSIAVGIMMRQEIKGRWYLIMDLSILIRRRSLKCISQV